MIFIRQLLTICNAKKNAPHTVASCIDVPLWSLQLLGPSRNIKSQALRQQKSAGWRSYGWGLHVQRLQPEQQRTQWQQLGPRLHQSWFMLVPVVPWKLTEIDWIGIEWFMNGHNNYIIHVNSIPLEYSGIPWRWGLCEQQRGGQQE